MTGTTGSAQGRFRVREALVAVLVLAVIAAVVSLNFVSLNVDSESRVQQRELDSVHGALTAFKNDMGRFPTESEGLQVLWRADGAPSGWHGPYLNPPIRSDRWGRLLVYRPPTGDGQSLVLESLGADGRPGTADDVRH